jgi:hypothetical protein
MNAINRTLIVQKPSPRHDDSGPPHRRLSRVRRIPDSSRPHGPLALTILNDWRPAQVTS